MLQMCRDFADLIRIEYVGTCNRSHSELLLYMLLDTGLQKRHIQSNFVELLGYATYREHGDNGDHEMLLQQYGGYQYD